jgi:hypothetical protein
MLVLMILFMFEALYSQQDGYDKGLFVQGLLEASRKLKDIKAEFMAHGKTRDKKEVRFSVKILYKFPGYVKITIPQKDYTLISDLKHQVIINESDKIMLLGELEKSMQPCLLLQDEFYKGIKEIARDEWTKELEESLEEMKRYPLRGMIDIKAAEGEKPGDECTLLIRIGMFRSPSGTPFGWLKDIQQDPGWTIAEVGKRHITFKKGRISYRIGSETGFLEEIIILDETEDKPDRSLKLLSLQLDPEISKEEFNIPDRTKYDLKPLMDRKLKLSLARDAHAECMELFFKQIGAGWVKFNKDRRQRVLGFLRGYYTQAIPLLFPDLVPMVKARIKEILHEEKGLYLRLAGDRDKGLLKMVEAIFHRRAQDLLLEPCMDLIQKGLKKLSER